MKVWVNLNHPNVVPLLGHSAEPEGPGLISPYYENGSVVDYLAAHPSADRNLIVGISSFIPMCAAIDIAHSARMLQLVSRISILMIHQSSTVILKGQAYYFL